MSEPSLTVVGWRERVDLPDWGIRGLIAKLDTGARTSAIHVEDISAPEAGNLSFTVVLSRKDESRKVRVTAPIVRETIVKSSSGHKSSRYVVKTRARLKGVERSIEVTLVSRPDMTRRMLLGREALAGAFLVDCSEETQTTETSS